MTLKISRIILILGGVMIAIFAAWEGLEKAVWNSSQPTSLTIFYLMRGISTAVIMTALTAYLLFRYRRRYEDQLREQSETAQKMRVFFENIVQDAGEAIVSLDNDGIIRTWNRSAEEIYGYKAAEIVGSSFEKLVPPDLLAAGEAEMILAAVRKNGYLRNHETRRLRKDGSTISVRMTASPLHDGEGRIIGSSAIISDTTAEQEMEARLIQAEKLAAIGQAAASTAHEVRNALAGISGTIEVLEDTAAWRELPEEVGAEVKVQIARISSIIDDLLNYARPGKLALRRADIHQILDRVLMSNSIPEAAGKRVVRRFSDGQLCAVVDPVRLEQAFQNLTANAYQAMEPGGTLEVTTRRAGGEIEVSFSDTGSGMGGETLRHALEQFYTTKSRGTGLGLAIVQAIVEAHGGRIHLASKPRTGTTVTVKLPGAGSLREPQATLDSSAA